MVPSDLKPSLAPSLRAWPQALRSKGDWRLPRYCSPLLVFQAAGLRSRGPLLVSPFRSRRLEAVFRSPMTTVRFRAAIMRSLFPTGLFNASLDFPEVRLARGSPLEPARPASASQRRLPVDLISVPDPGLASGLRCAFGVSPLADHSVPTNLQPKSSPSQTARCPLLLDRSVRRRRIFAPNSLLLWRLNVPQTSWNRFNSRPTGPKVKGVLRSS